MSVEQLLNAFRGRASRMRFWIVVSIILPSYFALLIVFWMYAISVPGAFENGGPTPLPSGPFGIIATIAYFGALIALTVGLIGISIRRLHDRGKSGLWVIIFLVVPNLLTGFAQSQIALYGGENVSGAIMGGYYLGWVLMLWGIIELGFLRGTDGTNRFGPDPLAQPAIAG
jgi:uncharacterized membrane protein YhaH (DUF805 family)